MLLRTATAPIKNLISRIESLDEKTFTGFVLLIYILLAGANIFTHEMWRDELHVWLTARDSASITELISNMRCQGHPPLWYLMLYGVTRLTQNPLWMQVLHLPIAAISAGVFLRFAPFSRMQRLLFVLGYFPLYEYAAISRNYSMGILLMFCFCAACRNIGKNFWLLSIILILMATANPYAFIIAICLFLAAVFRAATDASTRAVLIRKKLAVILCVTAIISGFAIAGATMFPKQDCQYRSEWKSGYEASRMGKSLSSVWQGLVPIPELKHKYWNSNIMEGLDLPIAPLMPFGGDWTSTIIALRDPQNVLGVILLCFFLLSLLKNRAAFMFFTLAVGAMLAFQYVVYIGALRHFGHFFIVVIISIWLERVWVSDEPARRGLLSRMSGALAGYRQMLVYTLLFIHFGVGLFASAMEWQNPFSEGKHAAKYVKDNGLDRLPIAGYQDFIASTAGGYLDRQIYYPNSDGFGTFVVFDGNRRTLMNTEEVLARVRQLADKQRSDVVLMLHYDMGEQSGIIALGQFTDNLQHDESFYLYLLKYQGQ